MLSHPSNKVQPTFQPRHGLYPTIQSETYLSTQQPASVYPDTHPSAICTSLPSHLSECNLFQSTLPPIKVQPASVYPALNQSATCFSLPHHLSSKVQPTSQPRCVVHPVPNGCPQEEDGEAGGQTIRCWQLEVLRGNVDQEETNTK